MSLYLSMEYIEGSSLDSFLKKNKYLTSEKRHKLVKGLLNGLKQLSRLNIAHRDIKTENSSDNDYDFNSENETQEEKMARKLKEDLEKEQLENQLPDLM